MVRAGEIGGFLDAVLLRLLEYLERSQEVRDEARAALAYPVVLTCAMGASILVLLTYVLPKFSSLFTDLGKTLPLSARVVLGVSDAVRGYWWLGLGIIALVGFVIRWYVRSPAGSWAFDQWKLRVIVLGNVLRKLEVAKIARTLGTLLKSGVPMVQALGIVKEIAGNQVVARSLAEVEVGVREGAGVAEPLARSGVFPPLAIQMISVGEETGRLDDMLLKVAEYFDRETSTRIQQFTRLLEPVLILVMGLIVGFIVVSMLSTIFPCEERQSHVRTTTTGRIHADRDHGGHGDHRPFDGARGTEPHRSLGKGEVAGSCDADRALGNRARYLPPRRRALSDHPGGAAGAGAASDGRRPLGRSVHQQGRSQGSLGSTVHLPEPG